MLEGDFAQIPNIQATWFVDPPYTLRRQSSGTGGGRVESKPVGDRYRYGASKIDFTALSTWCRERIGQTIACEAVGATWLPFAPFIDTRANIGARKGAPARTPSREAIWTAGCA